MCSASMHRRAGAVVGGPGHAVALGAQFFKDGHHRGFGRVDERAPGHVLGGDQQLFGFGQIFHAASLAKVAFSSIPFHLNSVEAS